MTDMRQKILDSAQFHIQTRGLRGFSYHVLARELGIKTASIHYHFPKKEDLATELIKRYTSAVESYLRECTALFPDDPVNCLRRFSTMFELIVAEKQKICLFGMLSCEHSALTEEQRLSLLGGFRLMEDWLSELLNQGKKKGVFIFLGDSMERAKLMISCFEGAMQMARLSGEDSGLQDVINLVLSRA